MIRVPELKTSIGGLLLSGSPGSILMYTVENDNVEFLVIYCYP